MALIAVFIWAAQKLNRKSVPDDPPNRKSVDPAARENRDAGVNESKTELNIPDGEYCWKEFTVAGYTHSSLNDPMPRFSVYQFLKKGDPVRFVREADNAYDANAVLIYPVDGTLKETDLGYVPRELAKRIAPKLAAGINVKARVSRVDTERPRPMLYVEYISPVTPTRLRKPGRSYDVMVQTPLGPVKLDNRKGRSAAIVALGRSEQHLRWFYDVHRKEVLQRAVKNLHDYQQGKSDGSRWSESYFDFIRGAPAELADLPNAREKELEANRAGIAKKEIAVLGTYESIEKAAEAAKYVGDKFVPTVSGGWLNVYAVAIPSGRCALDR